MGNTTKASWLPAVPGIIDQHFWAEPWTSACPLWPQPHPALSFQDFLSQLSFSPIYPYIFCTCLLHSLFILPGYLTASPCPVASIPDLPAPFIPTPAPYPATSTWQNLSPEILLSFSFSMVLHRLPRATQETSGDHAALTTCCQCPSPAYRWACQPSLTPPWGFTATRPSSQRKEQLLLSPLFTLPPTSGFPLLAPRLQLPSQNPSKPGATLSAL